MLDQIKILIHKAREHQQPLYMCFVDYKKAFDSIFHDKLWVTIYDGHGIYLHLIDLLVKLYIQETARYGESSGDTIRMVSC